MEKKTILVFGSGHLAYRLKEKLHNGNYEVVHVTMGEVKAAAHSVSLLENLRHFLQKVHVDSVRMIYLLDEKDEVNLQLIIALISLYPGIPVTASLFNENLTPHLQSEHNNVTIFNPAKIAAPYFVAALSQPLERKAEPKAVQPVFKTGVKKGDNLIQKLILSFTGLIIIAVFFFIFTKNCHG